MITYSITQQIKQSLVDNEYLNALKESFALLRKASDALTDEAKKSQAEVLFKSSQVARGSLNQFLSTPIKSDDEEIRRIIRDSMERYAELFSDMRNIGILHSWQAQLITGPLLLSNSDKNVKRLLNNGKKMLSELSMLSGKLPSTVFESVFVFTSTLGLAHLSGLIGSLHDGESEYLNSGTTGKASLSEIIHEVGSQSQLPKQWEVTLYPTLKPSTGEEFERACADLFTQIAAELNIQHIALWKRLLGLGNGPLYSIRLTIIPDMQMLAETIRWLVEKTDGELRASTVTNGGLVVKEILW